MVFGGIHPFLRFFLDCAKAFGTRELSKTFLLLILTYGSLFVPVFINMLATMLPWQHFYCIEVEQKFVKNDMKPHQFHFVWQNYEISVSELTLPPNFSLILLKIEKFVKSWTLNPKTENDIITGTSGDVINFIIVLDTMSDILAHDQSLF